MVYKSATWILGVASNGIYNIFWQIGGNNLKFIRGQSKSKIYLKFQYISIGLQ